MAISVGPYYDLKKSAELTVMFAGGRRGGLGVSMHSLIQWGIDHEQEAFLGSGELRYVVARVSPSNVLLHGPVSLFLRANR